MKQIFPFIDNNNDNHRKRSHKIKKLKLKTNNRLNTFNSISSFKSLKTEILNNFTKNKSPNLTSYKNNDFMTSIENFSKTVKDKMPIKEYSKISNNLMERYSYNNPKAETEENIFNYEDEMTKTKADYFLKKKKDIQNFLDKSKKLMKTLNDFRPQKTVIKFNSTDFRNPIDSLGLILKNKTIHDKVLDNYQNREIKSFGNNIRRINKIKEILNLTKNIKISTFMPSALNKMIQNDFNLEKGNEKEKESNIIKNLNEEKYNILTQDQKESFLKNKHKNSLIWSETSQKGFIYLLPGFYQSTKICPESREEFSLNHDPISNNLFFFS